MNNVYDIPFPDVTRVEVIDNSGRAYTQYRVVKTVCQLQDDGKTLKVFVTYDEEDEISND